MGLFDRQNMIISPQAAKMIKNLRILVVGAGAGGNELLKNLLLMGFGNITIIDFDTVEDSNLSRTTLFRKEDIGKSKSIVAAQRLQEVALHENPHIIGLHGNLITDFGKGIFVEHDVVFSCVDTLKCRAYINDWCVRTRTPFFEMGFSEYNVNVTFFCPEGLMTQKDGKKIKTLPTKDGYFPTFTKDFEVCLREDIGIGAFEEKRNTCSGFKVKDANLAKIPTIQVSSAMAATFCATELIKFLDGKDTIRNKSLMYFGLTYETMVCGFKRNPKCTIHDEKKKIIQTEVSETDTLADVLAKLEQQTGKTVWLKQPDSFVFSGNCHICGKKIVYNKRFSEIWDEERWCKECRDTNPDFSNRIEYASNLVKTPSELTANSSQEFLQMTIRALGIPDNDIVPATIIGKRTKTDCFIYLKQVTK